MLKSTGASLAHPSSAPSRSPSADAQQSLGVSLSPALTVNPVQNSTYYLTPERNPITFGAGTNIDTVAASTDAVASSAYGDYTLKNLGTLNAGGYGVRLHATGSVINAGSINGRGGIYLGLGGTVNNWATGHISGQEFGVRCNNNSTVVNSGTIEATGGFGTGVSSNGEVQNQTSGVISGILGVGLANGLLTNAGHISGAQTAVFLNVGADILNRAGGVISGAVGVYAYDGNVHTITNVGEISGTATGIALQAGGTVINRAGGLITGGGGGQRNAAVYLYAGASTLTNAGSISSAAGYGVEARASGVSISNAAGGIISGLTGVRVNALGSLSNAGTITGSGAPSSNPRVGDGIVDGGAAVTNGRTGVINGAFHGVYLYDGTRLTNAGQIRGTSGAGVYGVAGAITNLATGIIRGATAGIEIIGAGSLVNRAGGVISGAVGVTIVAGVGTVTNAGRIVGSAEAGIALTDGGSISNFSGGFVLGKTAGILVQTASGTVINAGTIHGPDAVEFTGSGANKLILRTGSAMTGHVVGSTAAGATNGLVLQGSGSTANLFSNFNALAVSADGTWTLLAASTFGAATISKGVLQVGDSSHSGARVVIQGTLLNNGVLAVGAGEVDVNGAVSGTGSVAIADGVLKFGSTFAENVTFTGVSGVLRLSDSEHYAGAVSDFAAGDKLDLNDIRIGAGAKATFVDNGSHTGGVLTVADRASHTAQINLLGDFTGATFTVSGDAHGGTIVQVSTAGASMISAMAAMTRGGGASQALHDNELRPTELLIGVSPRAHT